ncbi:MAG: UDP-glucose--hexose-1-phosphate uridylyltransferase [Lachnospiraceae bacterium]|nr:UDP-glucose--hexose-1-phosphate uridylyltransferase [Ruminococcus sp.]MCM1274932.1 UDP-glucose--hexose-1-phosphate uridylyltransferase [Lachnospiraceae bacterium]
MICNSIQKLIDHSVRSSLITNEDKYVVRNGLMDVLKVAGWEEPQSPSPAQTIDEILGELVDYACENGIIENTSASRDLFDTKLMGVVTPFPREVSREFYNRLARSPKEATDWYFGICKALNYVRAGRIAKDVKWTYESEFGTLDVTINLSKPEKDPRDIAAARNAAAVSYPKCQLCAENAGYAGRLDHPARQNLRPVPMKINGENWFFQYSPYGYYNEHCIVFNERHIPMKIDASVFEKLFDIIDILPHYFVGSNADLPIVGGSILSHEHFQGGHYTFAMEKAPVEKTFALAQFPEVTAGVVKWPMSVIRLRSENRRELSAACDHILGKWRAYSDPSATIFAETDNTPHNTITPIARKSGGIYECDLVLRNNLATEDRPLGLYHPNPSLHHIKKENIGLIEVMGLAVLPSRLEKELAELETAMLRGEDIAANPALSSHAEWAKEILSRRADFNEKTARQIIREETGAVFEQVLRDAGVFKRTPDGEKAFARFIDIL